MREIEELLNRQQQRVVIQLQTGLQGLGCLLLIGAPSMGKSTVLRRLTDEVSSPRIYVSLRELNNDQLAGATPPVADEALYLHILDAIKRDWGDGAPVYPPLPPELEMAERCDWFTAALAMYTGRPLTLILDDVELLQTCSWGRLLIRALGNLITTHYVRLIFAGTLALETWVEEMRETGRKAGAFDLVQTRLYLDGIPISTLKAALFDYPAFAQRLIQVAGGHPYLLLQLTQNLWVRGIAPSRLLDQLETEVKRAAYDKLFRQYWQSYDLATRQACFAFMSNGGVLPTQELIAALVADEAERAIVTLQNTGVLFQADSDKTWQLIDLFGQWYQQETGFHLVKPKLSVPPDPNPVPLILNKRPPLTEFTFFPNDDLVLVRRDRYLYVSKLGLASKRLEAIRSKTLRIPAADGKTFAENVRLFSQDLWQDLHSTEWYQELRNSVQDGCSLRFNIPIETMGEFPFELIPLDEDGDERIGLVTPITRQWVKEGRRVTREALTLPPKGDRALRILIVAAELGGDIWLAPDGTVRSTETSRGAEHFKLPTLQLEKEVAGLYETLAAQPALVSELTVLSNTYNQRGKPAGVPLRRLEPEATVFRQLLESEQFDLIHFAGHGLFMPNNPAQGGLLFADGLVHLEELAALLRKQQQLGFIYLSCCESGKIGADEKTSDLLGIAHACIQAGVPAVLAMRWRISVDASRNLSNAFYPDFLATGDLSLALHQAVQRVYAHRREPLQKVYAAAPVLVLH